MKLNTEFKRTDVLYVLKLYYLVKVSEECLLGGGHEDAHSSYGDS